MGKPRGINAKLGYNIKYLDPLPGNICKIPMYEITPGKWVSRGKVPEHQHKRKLRRTSGKEAATWKTYYTKNKKKIQKRKKKWRAANKEHCWQQQNTWNNTERGFIMNLYSAALKEFKKGRHGKGIPIPLKFTKKTWWEHWLKQKKKSGMYCPYTKVLMTTIRGRARGTIGGGKRINTNISKDQIWPGRGYTPINLIFCSTKFNSDKGSITPDGCEAVIDVHRKRMDDWAKELVLKRELRKIDIRQPENLKYFKKEFRKFKRSVSEKEYKCFIDIAYQKAIAERKEEQKLYEEWIKMGQPSREEWEKRRNARS